jgi:uncharacterized protein
VGGSATDIFKAGHWRTAVLIATLLVASGVSLFAAVVPIPPTPTRFVTDTAGFLSPQTADSLDRRLYAYQQQTGHQILVYIGQTTGDDPIEDWANRAFQQWKPGRKGMDDGLVLFIMAQDHRLRFEVGYGLEGDFPDALAGRVINEIMVPRIRAGDNDGAVTAGIDAVAGVLGGQGLPLPRQPRGGRGQARPLTLGQLIFYGIIGVVLLLVFITNPSLAIWLLMSLMSGGGGRSRDDGWGGGGGFSGGGGRSGGGGASGSW